MKKINKNSEVYYIEKMIGFKPLNISKIHVIDDDCNEFIATVTGINHMRGYIAPSEIKVIDYEEYTSEKWDDMIKYIEYERAIIA